MNNNVSSSKFWDDCYINDNTGWDIGSVTPVFKDWCNNLQKKYSIFVPGAGNGYDPLYFESKGHKNYIFGKDGVSLEAKKQNLNLLGEIPILPKISESGDKGKPLTFDQKSEVFKIFEKIAQKTIDAANKIKIKEVDISS